MLDKKRYILTLILTVMMMTATAQRFFNLTADEVRIDSVKPYFTYSIALGADYADSTYTVELKYPEFIDMPAADTLAYSRLEAVHPAAMPQIEQWIAIQQKKPVMTMRFVPVVYRNGRYQYLVSFMLDVKARCTTKVASKARLSSASKVASYAAAEKDIYTTTSVLSKGTWAKIGVTSSGVYQLTKDVISRAGFSDLSKVKIYGYGGNLQNETLLRSELRDLDDLKEVPTSMINGKRLFYAKGPVSWGSKSSSYRIRNPYSDYGYYFITQDDDEPTTVDSTTFVNSFYPSNADYHSLYEVDDYSWFEGGRNLFESTTIADGASKTYTIDIAEGNTSARLAVAVTAGQTASYKVKINGVESSQYSMTVYSESKGVENITYHDVSGTNTVDTVTITAVSGGPLRLDYILAQYDKPRPAPSFDGSFAAPEYIYNITNQNLHGDSAYQMVIIYPTSAALKEQAERLADYHRTNDNMKVRVVPADEIFNEFSSGTPDANAYRRYMKMLYDRAGSDESKMPKYLLLFGDGTYDNRMNTTSWRSKSPDDYLLCYESENSFSETDSYVNDGFFCALDDGEGADSQKDLLDIASGRFPVTTAAEAKVMVDKAISYMDGENIGPWVNTCMFMGDDGNNNLHMNDADKCAKEVEQINKGIYTRRVFEDAYKIVKSSTGNTYPDATTAIKKQMASGALLFNYNGHGSVSQMAGEKLLMLSDFESFTNKRLPLWFTASCNIMPFDRINTSIGETAVLNANGGSVAFIGTTRTVYADRNLSIDLYFLDGLFSCDDEGEYHTLGEALRLAKNALVTQTPIIPGKRHSQDNTVNKLHYTLLGDPAMRLHMPTLSAVVDSINDVVADGTKTISLSAGSKARVRGHIVRGTTPDTSFTGTVNIMVRDTEESVRCLINQPSETDTAFVYKDRTKVLFNGSNAVESGVFDFTFTIPMDINYADKSGLINLCAINVANEIANGCNDCFNIGGTGEASTDSIGPSVYCYLNSPDFRDGGNVNRTPYFYAELTDASGINTSGNGIGHDLQLIIDGSSDMTYSLNDNFTFDTGSYTRGSTYYSIPELTEGMHTLLFRAWDIRNNPTTTKLSFNVVTGLAPELFSVSATRNPASESTSFIITHNFTGSNIDAEVEIFDMSGRLLHRISQSGVSETSTITVDWDLTTSTGGRLQTGVYIYRANISSDGSSQSSKAKKLIIINN